MSNWVADKSEKDLTEQNMLTLRRGKGSYLRASGERERREVALPGEFYRDALKTEQTRHVWEGARRLAQTPGVSLRSSRAIQEELREARLKQSAWRVLSQNSWVDQPAGDQKEPGRGELIQQQVSEAENVLGLDLIVRSLEASRTKPRLAD